MSYLRSVSESSSLPPPVVYQVGGSLPTQSPSYVERQADDDLYTALKNREFCYILNSRQMGKSSLQARTMERLQHDQIRCLAIDLTTLGNQQVTPEQWYASMIHDLMVGFNLELDFMDWWEQVTPVSLVKRFSRFIEEVLLVQIQHPIVIFIDEVDSVLSLSFPCDDFFALLRACYNRRTTHPDYERLTIALVGVANPSDFMVDKQRTPFNIGRSIPLQGFTFTQSSPLLAGLQPYGASATQVLKDILFWTNGQPFLTQKLCHIVAEQAPKQAPSSFMDSDVEVADVGRPKPRLLQESGVLNMTSCTSIDVGNQVQLCMIDSWEAQDEPEHFRTIRNRILCDDAIAPRILGLYQRILRGESIAVDTSREQMELRLSGLVIEKKGILTIKNPIYQQIFNAEWVDLQLANLRPYTTALNAWVASQCHNQTVLLQGLQLKAALAWADDKHLSDLDYRFLSASQEQAQVAVEEDLASETFRREQAQIALKAAKEASEILGNARHQARQRPYAPQRRNRWVAVVTLIILSLLIPLRDVGGLQALELGGFDYFFRLRPVAPTETRVTLVTIDESDIQSLKQFPLSDQVLAQLLTQINRYHPRIIGLDIYRDLSVVPGHEDLVQVFQQIPNLIGIEKVIGTPIQPPPALAGSQQYGFADQVLDGDGTLRRSLLTISVGDRLSPSLALQLTLGYLEQEDIQPQPLPNNQMRLGQATLVPLTEQVGAYAKADMGGYQILLNYHGDISQFPTIRLQDMLTGNVSADQIRDRVVLIGVTAPTANDLLLTPYSRRINGIPTQMPGVAVHANVVSQLLSAALDGRPLMQVWPRGLDYLWMMTWILLGTLVGSSFRQMWKVAIASLALAISLFAICYGAFLHGWWIPLVPSVLGLGMGAIALVFITSRQSERLFLRHTVQAIMAHADDNPAATQIALEYLKQGESQRNQALIETISD